MSPDLFVITAETAIEIDVNKYQNVVEEALAFYSTLKAPDNQFLARSYMCYAHLFKPRSSRDIDRLEQCSTHIVKAIEFGKSSPRYHFIVVNSSILYWKLARPFLTLQSVHHLCGTLGIIVDALTKIKDHDKGWLLRVSLSWIESLMKTNQKEEAERQTKKALRLARSKCPEMLAEVISLLSGYGLVEKSDMEDMPSNTQIIYEINSLRTSLKKKLEVDKVEERIAAIIDDIQNNRTKKSIDPDLANDMLLEILLLCLQNRLPEKAVESLDLLERPYSDINFEFKVKFAEADMVVKKIGAEQDSYKKSIMTIRLKAISMAQDALTLSASECEPATIQSGCVTLWNLCLPVLQPNLRLQIFHPLQVIAKALERLDSMMVLLRCQVHVELAKCYQDQEKLIEALENFNKALNLDPGGQYKETILYHMQCINLKTNLYKKPETIEEKAGFLLEQAKSSIQKGQKKTLQPILLKIGEYLAPHTFTWGIKELRENSRNCDSLIVLRDKITKFQEAKTKGKAEMDRLSGVNSHKRFILWVDVAKLARKEEVWDVALTASRFALWFEDQYAQASGEPDEVAEVDTRNKSASRASSFKSEAKSVVKSPEEVQGESKQISITSKKDAILLSELHFIYAESLIYFLRQDEVHLGEGLKLSPNITSAESDFVKHQDYPVWESYCAWIQETSEECVKNFLQGGQQGVVLREWWIVNNSCVYIWNYLKHTIDGNNHQKVIPWLSQGFDLLMSGKGNANFVLVCQFAEALCQGFLNKHKITDLLLPDMSVSPTLTTKASNIKAGKKSAPATPVPKGGKKGATKDAGPALDQDIIDDLTKAVQIAESVYTNIIGNLKVGLEKRKALLCLWVQCKQVLNQPLKTLLPDEENTDQLSVACKSIVAVEMNHLNLNQYYVFPNTPSMTELIKMVEASTWSEKLIELEVWTKLATLSLKMNSKEMVDQCCDHISALQGDTDLQKPVCKSTAHRLLCYHNLIKGKSELTFTTKVSIEDREPALKYFTNAMKSAQEASDYNLAMEVVQHFWNAVLPHLSNKEERGYLKKHLIIVLGVLANLATDKNVKLLDPSEAQKKDIGLRAHLYSALFLCYHDSDDWNGGLEQAEKAALAMPRPTHQLILKYRALFKVNLGISPNGDMAKLERIEAEGVVSAMWYRISLTSSNNEEQLYALQQSIMLLQLPDNRYEKIECIIRLAEWLHINQFPIEDVTNQIDWAIDLAVSLKSDAPGTPLMPISEDNEEQSKPRSVLTHSIKTRQTCSTVQASLADEKVDVINRPKPLLSYVDEVMESVDERSDLRRLETIARLLVIKAKMVLYNGKEVKETILIASNLYKEILRLCLMNCETAAPAEEKPGTREGKKGGKPDKAAAKMSSKSSITEVIPSTLTDWSIFRIPDSVKDSLREKNDINCINNVTIPQPELSMIYLQELCEQLKMFGYTDFVFAILALQDLIGSVVLNNSHLVSLVHLRATVICQDLQLQQGTLFHKDLSELKDDSEFVENKVNLMLIDKKIKLPTPLPVGLHVSSPKVDFVTTELRLCDIQVEKAVLLIETGDFQTAKVLLEQALPYIDITRNFHSYQNYQQCAALLSAAEGNYTVALEYLALIQSKRSCITTCANTMLKTLTMLLKAGNIATPEVADRFIAFLQTLQNSYKNQSCQIQFVVSKMKCMVIGYQASLIMSQDLNSADIEVLVGLCKQYDMCIAVFSSLGFVLHSSEAYYSLSGIKYQLSQLDQSTDFQKIMFLDAVESLQSSLIELHNELEFLKSVGVVNARYIQFMRRIILNHCSLSQMFNYIAIEEAESQRAHRISEAQKEVIDKQIEAFIVEPKILSSLDQKWNNTCFSATEQAKSNADCAVRYSELTQLDTRALSSGVLGQALMNKSSAAFEDTLNQWDQNCKVVVEPPVSAGNPEEPTSQAWTGSLNREMYSLHYLTSAIEYLAQSVQIALLKQNHPIIQQSCFAIVEMLGYNAPALSAQYLSLYQSSVAAAWLGGLTLKALSSPTKSEISAHVNQLKKAYESNSYQLYGQCFEELFKKNSCWKKTLVFENHHDLLKDIEDKQHFLILQHSPCKRYLYSSLLQGSKSGGKSIADNPIMAISRHDVNFESLGSIRKAFEEYKARNHKYMGKLVYYYKLKMQTTRRTFLMDKLEVTDDTSIDTSVEDDVQEERRKLDTFYYKIVAQLWDYLKPAVDAFNMDFKMAEADSNLVLLPDLVLQELPLNALPLGAMGHMKSSTLDFSLQTYYHRLQSYAVTKAAENGGDGDKSKARGKTPTGSARGERKIVSIDKRIQSDKIPLITPMLDMNNFKYLVNTDSHLSGETSITEEFGEMLKNTQNKTHKWTGNFVVNSECSPVEVQELIKSSSGFLYTGIGKLLALVPVDMLMCLNMSQSHLHIVSDRATSTFSLKNEMFTDEQKDEEMLGLEQPLQLAGILYLNGSVLSLINQLENSCDDNISMVKSVLQAAAENEVSVGTALHMVRYPPPPPPPGELQPPVTPTKNKAAKPVKGKPDTASIPASIPELNVVMPDVIDSRMFNMTAFGVPGVLFGEVVPPAGRKSGQKK